MSENKVIVTGRLKSLRLFDQYGKMMTGSLSQRVVVDEGRTRAKFNMPICALDESVISALLEINKTLDAETLNTAEVRIEGEISTKYDLRRDVPTDQRKQPFTRILVHSVELV